LSGLLARSSTGGPGPVSIWQHRCEHRSCRRMPWRNAPVPLPRSYSTPQLPT